MNLMLIFFPFAEQCIILYRKSEANDGIIMPSEFSKKKIKEQKIYDGWFSDKRCDVIAKRYMDEKENAERQGKRWGKIFSDFIFPSTLRKSCEGGRGS